MYRRIPEIGQLHVLVSVVEDGSGLDHYRPEPAIELCIAALRGGADTIQFRYKGAQLHFMIDLGRRLAAQCGEYGVPFIVNDRVDIALLLDADGVHLGKDDMPVKEARKVLGGNRIIGGTARNADEVRMLYKEGADYVGCGPVYATTSKTLDVVPLGVSGLAAITEHAPVPVIAIGGITYERSVQVMTEGRADGIAVIGAVSEADDQEIATRRLADIVRDYSPIRPEA